jgi:UDP-GlcNAc3NAcA epimerase
MPEEINRIVADRLSSVLLCPTETAVENLASEGISTGVHLVGDVMYDVALHFGEVAATRTQILERLGLEPKQYVLATCHRAENTNDPVRLSAILRGLARVAAHKQVIFPAHPRTVRRIAELNLLGDLGSVQITEPASYLEMIALERNADVIVTDSGGVQKEAFFYRVPCVTVRDETEWVETMRAGWNTLVGADPDKIAEAVAGKTPRERLEISPYGTGNAGERILDVLLGPG